ncbi:MAG: TolC family protein, partial [Muribaculaceae bacterium]|nr:TolC family protein [Muribaculaceae bacterium]
ENYSLHRQALDRIKTLELSVKEAQENYRIVNNRYMSQLSILTDLLDAESVLMDSELQLTGAQVNALFTYCQLLQVCGKL